VPDFARARVTLIDAPDHPDEIRGRLGSFWQFAIVISQLVGLRVGYG